MIPFLNIQAITDRHGEEIAAAVAAIVHSGWYLRGEATAAFEQAYASFIGTRHCVGCANGLDALTLILKGYQALGVMKTGDEVIVPANTFIASVLAVTRCGLTPVFVEPNPRTSLLDDALVEAAITPRTRAVMVVHLYGRCAYTDSLAAICRKYGLKLIEDNAQAQGAVCLQSEKVNGKRTGSLGDAAGHSFYPGKNLGAMGDAGAVTTDDDQLATIVRTMGNYGMNPKYHCPVEGFNSRIDEIQAAVLSVKLRYLDEENATRRSIARYYVEALEGTGLCTLSTTEAMAEDNVFHIFPIFTAKRDALQKDLLSQGIETNIHYPIPPHLQPCFPQWNHLSFPIAEHLAATELSLPMSPVLTMEDAHEVIRKIKNLLS